MGKQVWCQVWCQEYTEVWTWPVSQSETYLFWVKINQIYTNKPKMLVSPCLESPCPSVCFLVWASSTEFFQHYIMFLPNSWSVSICTVVHILQINFVSGVQRFQRPVTALCATRNSSPQTLAHSLPLSRSLTQQVAVQVPVEVWLVNG
jgi:hypothetical protein